MQNIVTHIKQRHAPKTTKLVKTTNSYACEQPWSPYPALVNTASTLPVVFRGKRKERKEIGANMPQIFPRSDSSKLRSLVPLLSFPLGRVHGLVVSVAAVLVATGSASQLSAAACHPPTPPAGFPLSAPLLLCPISTPLTPLSSWRQPLHAKCGEAASADSSHWKATPVCACMRVCVCVCVCVCV